MGKDAASAVPLETQDRAGHDMDPMAEFGVQAGISIAAGMAGLALMGPVGAALGAAIGATGAGLVTLWSRRQR